MGNELPESREEKINEALRDLAQKVRELRHDLDQMLASLKMPRSEDPLFGSENPK